MTDYHQQIYHTDARRYERLVSREDQHGNLFQALMDIHPFTDTTVLEFGAGTGRITRIMSVLARAIHATDHASAMLNEGQRVLQETGMQNWTLTCSDNAAMPFVSDCADITIEGWSFGHLVHWYPDDWQQRIDRNLAEMQRLTRSGGTMILIETMGTGRRKPLPPDDSLARLYDSWQNTHGFNYQSIRTDYHFESVAEADELIRFFFGDAQADQWVAGKNIIVPECTGIWWKRCP